MSCGVPRSFLSARDLKSTNTLIYTYIHILMVLRNMYRCMFKYLQINLILKYTQLYFKIIKIF